MAQTQIGVRMTEKQAKYVRTVARRHGYKSGADLLRQAPDLLEEIARLQAIMLSYGLLAQSLLDLTDRGKVAAGGESMVPPSIEDRPGFLSRTVKDMASAFFSRMQLLGKDCQANFERQPDGSHVAVFTDRHGNSIDQFEFLIEACNVGLPLGTGYTADEQSEIAARAEQ